jgi:hypothetical protein
MKRGMFTQARIFYREEKIRRYKIKNWEQIKEGM